MTNFDNQLAKYRQRIANGGLQKLKEDVASGRIALDYKLRVANFAIAEGEAALTARTQVTVPITFWGRLLKLSEHPPIVAGILATAALVWDCFCRRSYYEFLGQWWDTLGRIGKITAHNRFNL